MKKNILGVITLLSVTISGCSNGSDSEPSFRSATSSSPSVRELDVEDNCSAWALNDEGQILLACTAYNEDKISTEFKVMESDDSINPIYIKSEASGYSPTGFSNAGKATVFFYEPQGDEPVNGITGRAMVIGAGEATELPLSATQFPLAQSLSGKYISFDQAPSRDISCLVDLKETKLASTPEGVLASNPLGINDSGQAVGIAYIGSEGTGFSTLAGYKISNGKFELLSFADRPELSGTIVRSISNRGDVLLEIDSGKTGTISSNSQESYASSTFVISEIAIFTADGELIKIPSPDPSLSSYGISINNNQIVLGTHYNQGNPYNEFFIYGRDKTVVPLRSLVPLKATERIFSAQLNNNDQVLVTVVRDTSLTNDDNTPRLTTEIRDLIVQL
jgi:hypothetical protein